MTVPRQLMAQVLALSDERDQWERRLQAEGRAAYQAGYEDALRDTDRTWARNPLHAPMLLAEPTQAELELRRYGPGGRDHFGDPRPGDYPGGAR
jgi:hypothetical protein